VEVDKMKHINKISNNINNNKNATLSNIEDAKYLMLLCKERSDLVIKTEFGIGHYRFFKFNQIQGNFVMEFQLLDDKSFNDTDNIHNNIGQKCFLTTEQYISVYSYLGKA
tara:strand:+ start:140 stop:469 length:330 start_codon:yes stop_codon:yes gene_type:complete